MTVQSSTPPGAAATGPEQFRDAMALLAAPVTVITTVDGDGRPEGFTASSVTSVSLAPPLMRVGVTHGSSCHRPLIDRGKFVVNVLGSRHAALAQRFATPLVDRLAGGEFETWADRDLPYLPDAAVLLRCALTEVVRAGDHDLLLARPLEVRTSGSSGALVWYQRSFHVPVQTSQHRREAVRVA